MTLLGFYLVTLTAGVLYQGNHANGQQTRNTRTLIKQCFHEGRWFPAGSIISAGRSIDWCYGSFCDMNGEVKHWDDYNCPPPDQKTPNLPFPRLQSLAQGNPAPPATTTTPAPVTRPQPVAPSGFWFPTTASPFFDSFSRLGCFYGGKFYWAGEDIENKRRGPNCLGTYCDFNGRVQHWQDLCRFTMTPPTVMERSLDPT